jgi:type IV secretion system protein TrbL
MSTLRGPRPGLLALLLAVAGLLACPVAASALAPAVGTQTGRARLASVPSGKPGGPCDVGPPVVGEVLNKVTGRACEVAGAAGGALGGLAGDAAGAVGSGILDVVARWMIGGATSITTFVSREMRQTTTPQLQSAWYEAQFQPMADLGAALGLLVAMVALASAAIRRSPEALAATLAGIARAGIGTGLVVALTVIGLGVADQVSGAVLTSSPHSFWTTASHAWGASGFGGFGSSALAMLIAIVEVFAALFVWLELIVRDAAIYLAVLFFPAALAAAIWPALGAWPGRLGRLLALFVILKPVALVVLSLAGNAAAAGLSFGGGASSSVGTILAATVIFALAAFAPWALMYLLAADAESAYVAAGLRASAVGAVGDEHGRSLRTGGGLRDSGEPGRGGSPGGGGPGGGGSRGGGRGPGPGRDPQGGGSPAGAEATSADAPEQGDSLPIGGTTIGGGSIGAAAGASGRVGRADASGSPARPESSSDDEARAPAGSAPAPTGEGRAQTSPTAGGASRGDSPHPSRGSAGTAASPQDGQRPVVPRSTGLSRQWPRSGSGPAATPAPARRRSLVAVPSDPEGDGDVPEGDGDAPEGEER